MYQLTYDSKILFDPYMQSTAITDAKYTGKSNSVSYLDFTIAPNHPLYNTIEKDKGLVEFYSDNVLKFRGKINEIEIDDYGYKIVSCNSVLQYLNHTRVRSYSTVPGDADLTAPTSVAGYFQWLIDQHNLHVKDVSERFEVGVNQGSALDKNDYILRSNDSYPTTLDEINDKVLDNLGGYLFVEYKDDRNILNLYVDVHSTNSQIIDFGSNILSISYKENDDELYTVVIPRGGTPEKKEGDTKDPKPIDIKNLPDNTFDTDSDIVKSGDCVYSISATKRYGYREYYYSNNDILDPSNLLKAAVLQLRLQMSPKVTIETKAIDLSIAYPGYEQLNIGDACRVRSARHNLDDYFMLSEMELDLNDPSRTTYTFGDEYVSLVGRQSNYLKQINSSIDRNYEDVNTAMSYGKAAAKLADTANKTADAANNTAVKANDKAQKATEDAFNANATANNAQSTANTANTTANEAQTTANNAQNTANNAQQTANSNKQSIADIEKQQSEQDKLLEQMQAGVGKAEQEIGGINDRLTQMDSDIEQAQSDIDTVRQETNQTIQNVKDSVSNVQSDVDAVTQKAEDLASDLDATKATVEQTVSEFGEVKTTATNAASKADQSLRVSTQASQTATEASQKATSVYEDAQTAITQSSQATQTANQVSLDLRTNYQTKTDADAKYATQASLTATSNQIRTEVSETYATQATVNALENLANNAVQTWMGDGVPSLSNKPASDWTTSELKVQHSGDLYYDTNTGYAYRFGSSDGTSYSWALVKDTDITKALSDAAKAQKTAEGVSDEVTQLKTDIPATYATKTEVKQTTDSIKSSVSEVATTANSALSKATTVEQTANGLQTTVTEQAKKLDGAVTTISQVSQRVDSVSSTITQVSGRVDDVEAKADTAQGTANSALSQSSRVEQSLNSFKTSVSRDYETKSDASSKQSSLQQSVNNLRTEVSETYTTKTEFTNLNNAATKTYQFHANTTSIGWYKLGTWSNTNQSDVCAITIYAGNGQNGRPDQNREVRVFIRDGFQSTPSASGAFGVTIDRIRNADNVEVQVRATASNSCDIWYKSDTTYAAGRYTISIDPSSEWTHSGSFTTSAPSSGTLQTQEYQTYSTKSYVDQTAQSVALGVVQNYKGADGSGLATKSDITVAKESITTTVSETYQTKSDMKNYATQSQLTQTNDKVTIAFQNSQSVGGQNLLLGTSVPTIVTGNGAANQCVAYYSLAVGSLKNLPVGMYHMQFKIKSDTAGGVAYAQWNTDPWSLGSHKVNIGTTEQTYSVDYYITNNNYPDAKQMSVRLDNAQGNVTIREMKLERGNSMTPWTAAPEDTMNDLTNAVQNQAVDIAGKVSNDDYIGYVNATNKNLKDIQSSQQHLSDSISNEITLRESYIQFGQDASNPYMDMGNSSSPNKMRLTNTKLSFTSNNIEVASVSNDKMRISNAEVLQSFRIGNFVWQPRSDGHMALKYSPEV